jgi:hypothetical protein
MGNSYLDGASLGLDLSIADLAVVNDNGITTRASGRLISPANALGELSIRVGQEQLIAKMVTD